MPESRRAGPAQLVMAFDYGRRRIGVACGDTLSGAASPLAAVPAAAAGPQWTRIDALIRAWQPAFAVVGLPYNADGSEGAMADAARAFAADLASRYGMRIELVDERYSSLDAAARLRGARQEGLRRRRVAKADVDAAAACIILERWFTGQS